MKDLRFPTGLLFVLFGLILLINAALNPGLRAPMTDINVNLWWGLVLDAFGIVTLLSAAHSRRSSSGS